MSALTLQTLIGQNPAKAVLASEHTICGRAHLAKALKSGGFIA